VLVGNQQVGALEVSGPLTERDNEFRAEIMQILGRTALAGTGRLSQSGLLVSSSWGAPCDCFGQGETDRYRDLSQPLELKQRDEVGELATEINQMCERLAAAQARVEEETNQRIAVSEQLRHADRLTTVGKLASAWRTSWAPPSTSSSAAPR